MRSTLILTGIFLMAPAMLPAQQPPALINPAGADAAPAELPAGADIDKVLDALDQRGQSMREFTAKVSLSTGDPFVGGISTRAGQVTFQKKADDQGRLRVQFEKRIEHKVTRDEKSEYLLDNDWLIERDYRKHTETSRQVMKPGDKMNLLKLGEGPFPLPIGQKKEEVHKQFEVTLIPPAKDDAPELAGTIHLKLTPKDGTRFARRFGAIDVWVDRKTNFPARIDTVAPDGSDKHTTKLENVKINPQPPLKDGDFELPKIDKDAWSLHVEPYKE